MDPSHFRGPQLPTSHVVPGAPGALGHPPHFGFMEPPFIIPAAFLTEIITAIRSESTAQNRLLTNHYSNLKQDYNAIKEDFQLCVHQTDRILTEQYTRFELRLEGIQKGMRQFHETQTAAITDLGARLDVLEGLTEASRNALTSKIATVVETMGQSLNTFISMIKNDHVEDAFSFRGGIPPYSSSLEANTGFDGVKESHQQDRDELYEGDTPPTPAPATSEVTGEPLALPAMDPSDTTTIPPPPSPPTIPTPSADYVPPQYPPQDLQDLPQDPPLQISLFDAPSPLTPMSTPCSQNQGGFRASIMSPEIETPELHPTSADTASRKRKRASHGRGASKKSRRNGKSRPKEQQEDIFYEVQQPEGNHADPSIWPPIIEEGASDQMYVECDRCKKWFHFGCVGLRADHEDGSHWNCPLCVRHPTRDGENAPHGGGMCSRPGCAGSEIQEYFMDRLLGRCYVPDQDVVKYLVAYEGYDLDQCTWESPESFSNDPSRIKEFLEWWATENPGVDVESLDPHETIFLQDAFFLARTGFNWPGI